MTIDANCCIDSVLNFRIKSKTVKNLFSPMIREFILECHKKNIIIWYYPFIRNESESNLMKALKESLEREHLTLDFYEQLKCTTTLKDKLCDLFDNELTKRDEKANETMIKLLKTFFELNKRDIVKELNLQRSKHHIPEDPDLKLISCLYNELWNHRYVLTDDGHFIGYTAEVERNFKICVLPMRDIRQIMRLWKWEK